MKLHGSFLDSSINYEMDLEQQCVFLKICLYSLRCGMEPGIIADNDGKAIPLWYMADCIHAPAGIVEETLEIGKQTNRIRENGTGCLEIVNWKHYQSEYDRQKTYREEKKNPTGLVEANRIMRARVKKLGRELTSDEMQEIRDSVQGCIEEGGSTERLINEWETKE